MTVQQHEDAARPWPRKTCGGCGKNKPLRDFDSHRSRPDGLSYHCKTCRVDLRRASRGRNPKSLLLQASTEAN